jgi:hypothetical protein
VHGSSVILELSSLSRNLRKWAVTAYSIHTKALFFAWTAFCTDIVEVEVAVVMMLIMSLFQPTVASDDCRIIMKIHERLLFLSEFYILQSSQ